MASVTSWQIIEAFHTALLNDAPLLEWAQSTYNNELKVLKGVNFKRLPHEDDCPLIALLPQNAKFGRVREHVNEIRMVLAVGDERFENDELAGLFELANNFGPLALNALRSAEVAGFYIGEVTDLYELQDFPVLYREFFITVTSSTCIGGSEL